MIYIKNINSWPTQGRVERWDAMKPLYYRSVSSKGAGRPRLTHRHKGGWKETKWMRWVWRNGVMKFVLGENGRNPVKNLPRPRFVHHENHMEWARRERDPSGGRRAPNRLRHEAAFGSNMNGTDFITSIKPHTTRYRPWKGEVVSLPFLSDSCELIQSCLSSTREMSEERVLFSVEQRIIIKFLTAEEVQPSEILQRLFRGREVRLSRTRVFE